MLGHLAHYIQLLHLDFVLVIAQVALMLLLVLKFVHLQEHYNLKSLIKRSRELMVLVPKLHHQ